MRLHFFKRKKRRKGKKASVYFSGKMWMRDQIRSNEGLELLVGNQINFQVHSKIRNEVTVYANKDIKE